MYKRQTLLREFVEKIVVHESVALDGKRRGKLRRQEIEIYYSFGGKVELPLSLIHIYIDQILRRSEPQRRKEQSHER